MHRSQTTYYTSEVNSLLARFWLTSKTSKTESCLKCKKEMKYSWEAKKWICDECQLSRDGPEPPAPPSRRKGRLTLDDKIDKWFRKRVPRNKEDLRKFLIEQLEGLFRVLLFYVIVFAILLLCSELLGAWYFLNPSMKGEVAIGMLQAIISVDSALIGFAGVIAVFGLREISRTMERAHERSQLSHEDEDRLNSWQTNFLWSLLLTVIMFAASILTSLQSVSYATVCTKVDDIVTCIISDPQSSARFLLPLYAMFLGMAGIVWIVWSVRNPLKFPQERLKITTTLGFVAAGTATSEPMLYLEAVNVGDKPVSIDSIPSLMLADDWQIILVGASKSVSFPCKILPGDKCLVWDKVREIARSLQKEGYSGSIDVIAQFKDSVGNSYRSKPFPFDIDAWLAE